MGKTGSNLTETITTTSNSKITKDSGKKTPITIEIELIKMALMESPCKSLKKLKNSTLGSNSKMAANSSIWTMEWMEKIIITRAMLIITTGNSMAVIRILIRVLGSSRIITIITEATTITNKTKTTRDNGTTTNNNNSLTTTTINTNSSSKWAITHHLLQIKMIMSLNHFTQVTISNQCIMSKCKMMWTRFILSQILMLIAFIHDKFIMLINRMIIRRIRNQLLTDKCRTANIFQAMLSTRDKDKTTMAALSINSKMVLKQTMLKHKQLKWIAITLLNGDLTLAPSPLIVPPPRRTIRQMPSHGSHLLNEMKIEEYYSAEKWVYF